jgi:ABC transporter substrate binding protein
MGKGSTYGPVRWAARNGDLYRSRRDCIWLALSVAALLPFRALGESLSRVWRMGFLAHGHESFYDALFESLAPLGYVEGKNLIVERRYAEGHPEQFAEFAADMVRLKADIIIVATTPAALAVKSPTTATPVVFPNAISPVESGVVASLANPGGNIREEQHRRPFSAPSVWRFSRKSCRRCREARCSGMPPIQRSLIPGRRASSPRAGWDSSWSRSRSESPKPSTPPLQPLRAINRMR